MHSDEVKGAIILATIECIEEFGISQVTVRKIAQRAEVNVAAVNYHFGSKEALLKQAMDATLNEGFVNNINDYQQLWESAPTEALRSFLTDTLQGIIRYPNLTKAHFSAIFNENEYSEDFTQKFTVFLNRLHNLIQPILKEPHNKVVTTQLFSTILFAGMMSPMFHRFDQLDLTLPQDQQQFIDTLMQTYTTKPTA
ncbi:MAG: TetR/AcrR family transcriptional regulator [Candidatus Cloacimonetes bacterium]|nr:TetR/AcrR family transcriptional regulator [Candidatus Cloacimonadota bacterium]